MEQRTFSKNISVRQSQTSDLWISQPLDTYESHRSPCYVSGQAGGPDHKPDGCSALALHKSPAPLPTGLRDGVRPATCDISHMDTTVHALPAGAIDGRQYR
ncbi:hypothetical protein TNCT_467441 [Trichonephila clavata]|uniref:Uncharacterized protein n=1 Tax=Trichonephila clavata TaxID=2740835 RepID=A0A8X6GJ62_TRICU|nr:hypothetical protein TNCT_467441 [Trichonephila clavata]